MLALLKRVTIFSDRDAQNIFISDLSHISAPKVVSFLNQHAFNLAYRDAQMAHALHGSDILMRDGVGIEIAMRCLGLSPGINSNGTDVIPLLLEATRGRRLAVFGTQDPWLSLACSKMLSSGVMVVEKLDGFQHPDKYLEICRDTQPDIVLLAMGMPKQEILSSLLRQSAQKPCIIINGGAIADFMAGKIRRAPVLIQKLRLEWLFRLACEPSRLTRRYLIGGPLFLARIANLWLHGVVTKARKIAVD